VAWGAQGGRTPVIAVQSKDPQANSIKWSDIASGSYDDLIYRQAQQLQTLATLPSVLVFHHEPENDSDGAPGPAPSGRCGTPEDFRRAADRFRRVVRLAGVAISEALFGITLTQPTY